MQVVSPIHLSPGTKRGDLKIFLQSPSGTRSTLLDTRPHDYSVKSFIDWPFMSVHYWGENPEGTWTLEIHNNATSKWNDDAKYYSWSLQLYGIQDDPNKKPRHERNKPKKPNVPSTAGTTSNRLNTGLTDSGSQRGKPAKSPSPRSVGSSACLSKANKCTKDMKSCHKFPSDKEASIYCKCTKLCRDTFAVGGYEYAMTCQTDGRDARKNIPFFCQFITAASN